MGNIGEGRVVEEEKSRSEGLEARQHSISREQQVVSFLKRPISGRSQMKGGGSRGKWQAGLHNLVGHSNALGLQHLKNI